MANANKIIIIMNFKINQPLNTKEYIELFQQNANGIRKDYSDEYIPYLQLNYKRFERVIKNYDPSNEVINAFAKLSFQPKLYIITEPWCGDAAQSVPVFIKIWEKLNYSDITFILRDKNPDIMDLYLTDGNKRSIPIAIFEKPDGSEWFHWGPRPQKAQIIFDEVKKQSDRPEHAYEALQKFYNEDKGKSIEEELMKKLVE
ncbi:MAG: thioredoxin [Bacteroidia bacterium]|nr:MAG: thioredoxin [Bacteroidia bacterium]GIV28807.1 MAG: thioredoxin [Bacteroidia bacterium]